MNTPDNAPPSALAGLAAEADGLETIDTGPAAPGEGGAPAEPEAPAPSNAQLIAGMLELGRDVFCQVTEFQSPKAVLQAGACTALGEAWGRVLDKRGIDLNRYLGDYGAEIAALVVTWRVGSALYSAVQAEGMHRDHVRREKDKARTVPAGGDAEPSGDGGS